MSAGSYNDHFRLKIAELRVAVKLMKKDEKQLAKQCSQLHFSSTSSSALLTLRNELGLDVTWTPKQMQYLTRQEDKLIKQFDEIQDKSSADVLLENVSKQR